MAQKTSEVMLGTDVRMVWENQFLRANRSFSAQALEWALIPSYQSTNEGQGNSIRKAALWGAFVYLDFDGERCHALVAACGVKSPLRSSQESWVLRARCGWRVHRARIMTG